VESKFGRGLRPQRPGRSLPSLFSLTQRRTLLSRLSQLDVSDFTSKFLIFLVFSHTYRLIFLSSLRPVSSERISEELLESCVRFARDYKEARVTALGTGTESALSKFGFRGGVASSATSFHPDGPYAVSKVEADCFYAGLASEPTLIYRTDVEEKWPRLVDPRPSAD